MHPYGILDLLDESPWFLAVPWAPPGPRGAAGGPTARPEPSREHPDIPSSSSSTAKSLPRSLRYRSKYMENQGSGVPECHRDA